MGDNREQYVVGYAQGAESTSVVVWASSPEEALEAARQEKPWGTDWDTTEVIR